jgi:hypothetical protein
MLLVMLSTLHVFDSQNIILVLLPIDTLHHILYIRISQPITKRHVYDIQNMPALFVPTNMAQHTLCTSISDKRVWIHRPHIALHTACFWQPKHVYIAFTKSYPTLHLRVYNSVPTQRSMFLMSKTCQYC